MSTIPKKISELALATNTANNTITVVSQGNPMQTYKISVNDLIKSSQYITSKVDQTDFNDLKQRVSDAENTISDYLPSMYITLELTTSSVTNLAERVNAMEPYISGVSGIKYTNYVRPDGNTVKIEL